MWAYRNIGGKSKSPEMHLLNYFDLNGRIAIDVGAHAGNWAIELARRVGPRGLVLAYEALPHYGGALSASMRLLRKPNIRVRVVAVGERPGRVGLRWRSTSNELLTGRTHVEPSAQASAGVAEVEMVSLDQDLATSGIKPTDVAFVKIDVEGAELEVLRGATTLLSEGRPIVYLEAEPQWLERAGHTVRDLFAEMARHGYQPKLVGESELIPTDAHSYVAQYNEGRAYNDVLFVHPASCPDN